MPFCRTCVARFRAKNHIVDSAFPGFGPEINFVRAATYNDAGNRLINKPFRFATQWRNAGLYDLKPILKSLVVDGNKVVVEHDLF